MAANNRRQGQGQKGRPTPTDNRLLHYFLSCSNYQLAAEKKTAENKCSWAYNLSSSCRFCACLVTVSVSSRPARNRIWIETEIKIEYHLTRSSQSQIFGILIADGEILKSSASYLNCYRKWPQEGFQLLLLLFPIRANENQSRLKIKKLQIGKLIGSVRNLKKIHTFDIVLSYLLLTLFDIFLNNHKTCVLL